MNETPPPQQAAPRMLDAVTAAFAARGLLDAPNEAAVALDAAREHAALTLPACPEPAAVAEIVAAPFAARLLVELLSHAELPEQRTLRALADELALDGVAPLLLLRETLRCPALLALEPMQALRAALAALAACAPLRHVSLWSAGAAGRVVCRAQLGASATSAAARRAARATIEAAASAAASSRPPAGGEMVSAAIAAPGLPVTALVGRCARGSQARARAFLAEAAGALAAVLEREALLAASAAGERMLLQASERRLTRLGYDIHDGPLQELLLVGEDLALFRRQLASVLEGRRGKELLGGRLDDLDARLVALERALRSISAAVHPDTLAAQPFREALRALIGPFAARSGIAPRLDCRGDLDDAAISTSQRLAVLSVVGEALNNVREHSGARAVDVSIARDDDGLLVSVRDDGRGFDVERELLRAARSGRMGLAGMYERVRLLDGHCRVESRPGGPTEVVLSLPRWRGAATSRQSGGRAQARG